ncbi:MAG: hypothetical protein HYY84_02265 [Deltaproteobacteria bacterium]|nr:hypothetical protein [Deltaproteobacteria bacterium]
MKQACWRSNVAVAVAAIVVIAVVDVAACGKTETAAKKSLGATCAAAADCTTGNCVDQVCCNTRCDGGCERCDYQPNVGSCTAVPTGQDPDNDCADQGSATCGTNGTCNGNRSCSYYSSSFVCVAAMCEGAVLRPARNCDGVGACSPVVDAGTDCTPYGCDNTTGCTTSCVPDGGVAACASNASCVVENDAGVCKGQTSANCTSNAQCLSSACDGGLCQ